MWELPKFYISACSNSVLYVRLHPILMSILLYHLQTANKMHFRSERIVARVNDSSKEKSARRKTKRKKKNSKKRKLEYVGQSFYKNDTKSE